MHSFLGVQLLTLQGQFFVHRTDFYAIFEII